MAQIARIENSRVMTVLDDTIHRMVFLAHVPLDLPFDSPLFQMLPASISQALRELLTWEHELQKAQRQTEIQKTKTKTKPKTANELVMECQKSTRLVVRALKDDKESFKLLCVSVYAVKNALTSTLMEHLKVLQALVAQNLSTSVEEDEYQRERMNDINTRTREAEEVCRQLQVELKKQKDQKNKDKEQYSSLVDRLKAELFEVKNNAEQNANLIEQEARQDKFSSLSAFEEAQAKDSEIKLQLQERFAKAYKNDEVNEEELRKQRVIASKELNHLIERYNNNMSSLQNQIDDVKEAMERERVELDEFSKFMRKYDQNRVNMEAEIRAEAEAFARECQLREKMVKSCTRIQAVARGYLARRMVKAMKARNKKKKSKGSKKKKTKTTSK